MSGREAALPPAFSLLNSEFNPFLFASIGEESNDTELTVLSALARLGVDPWQEATRLTQLSKTMATQRLTSVIAGLPDGRWEQSQAGTIAARLIELLPAKRSFEVPSRAIAGRNPQLSTIVILLLVALLGGITVFTIKNRMQLAGDADSVVSTTTNSPSAPLAGSE
jgi:hypothetical protein